MREKIIQMLKSADIEMVKLGMVTCLGMGEKWCRENIPYFGPGIGLPETIMIRSGIQYTYSGQPVYVKNSVGIRISPAGYIDCRMVADFINTAESFTFITLD